MSRFVPLAPRNLGRPPEKWSPVEVKAWLKFCVEEYALSPKCQDYFGMNGKALTILTREDFIRRAPDSGDVLFNDLQQRLDSGKNPLENISTSGSSDMLPARGTQPEADFPDNNGACPLLWEFLYQRLQDTNWSGVICWEPGEDFAFRILKPEDLASAWGQQKHRNNMDYGKMSRVLRQYYKTNIMRRVIGKSLTYQFLQDPAHIQKCRRGARPHLKVKSTSDTTKASNASKTETYSPDSSLFSPLTPPADSPGPVGLSSDGHCITVARSASVSSCPVGQVSRGNYKSVTGAATDASCPLRHGICRTVVCVGDRSVTHSPVISPAEGVSDRTVTQSAVISPDVGVSNRTVRPSIVTSPLAGVCDRTVTQSVVICHAVGVSDRTVTQSAVISPAVGVSNRTVRPSVVTSPLAGVRDRTVTQSVIISHAVGVSDRTVTQSVVISPAIGVSNRTLTQSAVISPAVGVSNRTVRPSIVISHAVGVSDRTVTQSAVISPAVGVSDRTVSQSAVISPAVGVSNRTVTQSAVISPAVGVSNRTVRPSVVISPAVGVNDRTVTQSVVNSHAVGVSDRTVTQSAVISPAVGVSDRTVSQSAVISPVADGRDGTLVQSGGILSSAVGLISDGYCRNVTQSSDGYCRTITQSAFLPRPVGISSRGHDSDGTASANVSSNSMEQSYTDNGATGTQSPFSLPNPIGQPTDSNNNTVTRPMHFYTVEKSQECLEYLPVQSSCHGSSLDWLSTHGRFSVRSDYLKTESKDKQFTVSSDRSFNHLQCVDMCSTEEKYGSNICRPLNSHQPGDGLQNKHHNVSLLSHQRQDNRATVFPPTSHTAPCVAVVAPRRFIENTHPACSVLGEDVIAATRIFEHTHSPASVLGEGLIAAKRLIENTHSNCSALGEDVIDPRRFIENTHSSSTALGEAVIAPKRLIENTHSDCTVLGEDVIAPRRFIENTHSLGSVLGEAIFAPTRFIDSTHSVCSVRVEGNAASNQQEMIPSQQEAFLDQTEVQDLRVNSYAACPSLRYLAQSPKRSKSWSPSTDSKRHCRYNHSHEPDNIQHLPFSSQLISDSASDPRYSCCNSPHDLHMKQLGRLPWTDHLSPPESGWYNLNQQENTQGYTSGSHMQNNHECFQSQPVDLSMKRRSQEDYIYDYF